jgi:hypothetical protein
MDVQIDGRYTSLILLILPIYFLAALIYGSATVVSISFLIASPPPIIMRRNALHAIFCGMSIGSYLYPMMAIPFL